MSEIKLTKRFGLTPKQKLQMVKFNAGDVGITADQNVLRCLLEKGMIYQSEIDRRARPVYKLTPAGLAYCKKHFTTNPDTK